MSTGRTQSIARRVEKIFRDGTLTGLSDQEVLCRYVNDRDPAAFEAILGRHGGMVANVCRRILRNPEDAEDAFQATFLALACRAGSLRVAESLGPWLYRVASRIAARSRADRRRRTDRERAVGPFTEPCESDVPPLESDEMSRIVHEELARFLRDLRNLIYSREKSSEKAANGVDAKRVEKEEKREKTNDRNARIRRLLDQLRDEIEKLPADRSTKE